MVSVLLIASFISCESSLLGTSVNVFRGVLCARTAGESEGVLRCLGWGKAKATLHEGMREERGQ
jgi:hypothetical protein